MKPNGNSRTESSSKIDHSPLVHLELMETVDVAHVLICDACHL